MNKEDADKLQELLDLEEGLSVWEFIFIDSLKSYLSPDSCEPTERQLAKMNQIYADKFEGGYE